MPPATPALAAPTGLLWAALDLWIICRFSMADWVIEGEVVQGPPRLWAIRGVLYTQNYLQNSEAPPSRERHRNLPSYKVRGLTLCSPLIQALWH